MTWSTRVLLAATTCALALGCGGEPSGPTGPEAPSGATAQAVGAAIRVGWTDNSADEAGFEVDRSTAGPTGPFAPLASVGADVAAYQDANVDGVSRYCYRVRAVATGGASFSGYSNTACFQFPEPSAPAAPSDLTAAASSQTAIGLGWTDNAPDEAGFEVWRSTSGPTGTYSLLASLDPDAIALSDEGLTASTEYCYRVRAVGGGSAPPSAFTPDVCATTSALPPPAGPTALAAAATSTTAIALTWTDHASDETGFEIWRSSTGAGGTFTLLTTAPADAEAASDTGLDEGTQYCYEVRALGAQSVPPSAFSNTDCATTLATPPAPTTLTATAATSSRIDLAWQDNATGEAGYEVWRSTTGASGTFTLWSSRPADSEAFSDTGLSASTEYCYQVRATGAGGAPDSPFTAAECATTPAPVSVRIVMFGDSNTDRCEDKNPRISSYVSQAPHLDPGDPPLNCSTPGKVRIKWQALRDNPITVVNHAIASSTTGGTGNPGDPDRTSFGAPNARTVVHATTRFEAEVLGDQAPTWDGGEPINSSFPDGPRVRVDAFVPGPHDFVYVSMGTNDDAGPTRTLTPAQTEANLRFMATKWIQAGQQGDHFIITTLAPRDDANSPTSISARNDLIRALASDLGLSLVDLAAHVSDDNGDTWRSPSLNIGDGIHYTEAVRAWIGDQVVGIMDTATP